MSLAAIAAAIVGAAFLLAGGAKVAAGHAWPSQAAALGAPRVAVPVVPWMEIVLGALLCAQVARDVVATIATAVLACFTTLIVVRLAQGRRPPCACFGSWNARPLGWRHVARNGVLMLLAIVAIAA